MTLEALSKALERLHVVLVSGTTKKTPKKVTKGVKVKPMPKGQQLESQQLDVEKSVKRALTLIRILTYEFMKKPTLDIDDANNGPTIKELNGLEAELNGLEARVYAKKQQHIWKVDESYEEEFIPKHPWVEVWKQRMRRKHESKMHKSNKDEDAWVERVVTQLLEMKTQLDLVMWDYLDRLNVNDIEEFQRLRLNQDYEEQQINNDAEDNRKDDLIEQKAKMKNAFIKFHNLCSQYADEHEKKSIFEELPGVFEVTYTPWKPEDEYKRVKNICEINNWTIGFYMSTLY